MSTKATLRPLTGPEREAARLIAADHPVDLIERETGLSKVKILAARDLSEAWAAVTTTGAGNGHTPKPTVLIGATPSGEGKHRVVPMFQAAQPAPGSTPKAAPAPAPAADSDPAPDAATDAVLDEPPAAAEIDIPVYACGDANAVLARAEQSADPKMRAEALAIRGFINGLETNLDRGEKALAAQAKVDELRERLAQAERELAELDGEAAPATALLPAAGKPEAGDGASARCGEAGSVVEPTPRAAPALAKPKSNRGGGDPMAYNEAVRSWARRKGLKVGSTGRMSMDIVNLFKAEHPPVNA